MNIVDLNKAIQKDSEKTVENIINTWVQNNNKEYADTLLTIIKSSEVNNGLIIRELVKGYFRLMRDEINDIKPMGNFSLIDSSIINESLLEVLGYDRMVPSKEEQSHLIEKYFNYGDDTNYKFCTDPRYGLAAACAGWYKDIVKSFLEKCMSIPDAPLQYVAKNSLNRKYVKLR